MGLFDQMKMANEMLKGMSPEQIQKLMAEAKDAKLKLDEQVQAAVQQEIERRGLVTRAEAEQLIAERLPKNS